jgi:hypothetical protein
MTHHAGSINYARSVEFYNMLGPQEKGYHFNPVMANLSNVKYFLTKSIALDTSKYPLVYQGEINIFENPTVLPRAFLVRKYSCISSKADILRRIGQKDFDPKNEVILEDCPERFNIEHTAGLNSAEITEHKNLSVNLKTETDGNAILILTDTNYPGWKAFINGLETKIYTADYIFRAIYLPNGVHTVEFRFEPPSFKIGLWITFLSLIVFMNVVFYSFYRRNGECKSPRSLHIKKI